MRDFTEVLTDLDYGSVHKQLSDELSAVVAACRATNKVGNVVLTIKIEPEGDRMLVRGEVKSKVPKGATNATMFFSTIDGELRQEDPRQLPLKHVPKTPENLRVLKEKRAEEKEEANG